METINLSDGTFITHGCIDRFSRLIVFLHCSTNNKSTTVLNYFLSAVRNYGLPCKIRMDKGGRSCLLQRQGINSGSVITGSSVHNQRIERLWVDVYSAVLQLFYRLFYFLENTRILDPQNTVHILALHYVYVPRIQESLLYMVGTYIQLVGVVDIHHYTCIPIECFKLKQTTASHATLGLLSSSQWFIQYRYNRSSSSKQS